MCALLELRVQREGEKEGLAKLCNEVMNPAAERSNLVSSIPQGKRGSMLHKVPETPRVRGLLSTFKRWWPMVHDSMERETIQNSRTRHGRQCGRADVGSKGNLARGRPHFPAESSNLFFTIASPQLRVSRPGWLGAFLEMEMGKPFFSLLLRPGPGFCSSGGREGQLETRYRLYLSVYILRTKVSVRY